jgi:hypothetical protein
LSLPTLLPRTCRYFFLGITPEKEAAVNTTLLSAKNWAETEFSGAALGDTRRSERLVRVATALAQNSHGVLHKVLTNWAELKAAYRLLEQDEVTYERVSEPHKMRTREACAQPGEFLFIEDTSSLNYTTLLATQGLGRIGDDRAQGLYLHSSLVFRVERWRKFTPEVIAVGLSHQALWARTTPSIGQGKENRTRRLKRDRESQRWTAGFDNLSSRPKGTRWTYLADRESDIFEVFEHCRKGKIDWIIRANQPRALEDQEGTVFSAIEIAKPLGSFKLKLRARPGQKRRTAKLELRTATVNLRPPWRPGESLKPLETKVIEAREEDAPIGIEPIRWVLLSSWNADTFEAALRVVKTYTRRWLIEEYHKALKTGASVEESQLTTASSLGALIGILAVVAVRLLNMKLLATTQPDEALELDEFDPDALTVLEKQFRKPKGGWTHLTVLVAVARIGGFLARKHDGKPGWMSIWRGWHNLMLMVQGYNLAKNGG